jgi:spore maturation protein CgeB
MKVVLFYHSLVSDWNHGNAHFLRGVVRELQAAGHTVDTYEPADGWSRQNLIAEAGEAAVARFAAAFPDLRSRSYDPATLDLDRVLDGADLVIVHEWNDPALVAAVGAHRLRSGRYILLFHDTHHRAVSAPAELERFDLSSYDGVLAFGEVLREAYLKRGWARRAWTWHEAADTAVFRPLTAERTGDLVWIGNWGDDERTAELHEFLLAPVRELGLAALVHGVRYPPEALQALSRAGIRYGGWLPNDQVPAAFARHAVTMHVPRRPYVEALPGIPTIRVFEALACGIPLLSSWWHDAEGLFRIGTDFLMVRDGASMQRQIRAVLNDPALVAELSRNGLATIEARHSCAHRVRELLAICAEIRSLHPETAAASAAGTSPART